MGSAEDPPSGHHASPPPQDCGLQRRENGWGLEREGERSWQLMSLAEHQDHLLEFKFIGRRSV